MSDYIFPNEEQPGRYGRPDMYAEPISSKDQEKNPIFFLLDKFLELPTRTKAIAGGVALLILCVLVGSCALGNGAKQSAEDTATGTSAASQETAEKATADPSKFDSTAYGVTVEVNDALDQPVPYTVVSVYCDNLEGFSMVKQAIYDAALAYGLGDSIDAVIGSFDAIAGTDASSDTNVPANGDAWQLVATTPSDYQPCYGVDLYIAR